ncbi:MAG: metallopeptidase family protein [Phycisphaerales bacterium]
MNRRERDRFDALLEEVLDSLPPAVHDLLDEAPLIVEDHPSAAMMRELGVDSPEDLCGLHTGIAMTEQSVEHSGVLPTQIHIFREGIIALAGGWRGADADDRIAEEIRITVLHEVGHHFGLEEDDLDRLGFA